MADWQAFGDALRIACPYIRFFRDLTHEEDMASEPPPVTLKEHICDHAVGPNEMPYTIWVRFDPEWRLEWVPQEGFPRWRVRVTGPLPYAMIRSKSSIYPASHGEPEHVGSGEIHLAIEPNNEGHIAFFRKFQSLLGKFSSNRHQLNVWTPDYLISEPKIRSDLWLGHEAIRWALQDSRRVLDYHRYSNPGDPTKGAGVRPVEDKWSWLLEDKPGARRSRRSHK